MSIDKKYKLYVFDLDGTLVDTKIDIGRALQSVVEDAGGGKVSLELLLESIGRGAKETIQNLTGLDEEEAGLPLEQFKSLYEKLCSDNTTIYEGGEELLHKLKKQGAFLALITMKSRIPTHKILKAHNLTCLFDDVISFDDIDKQKPHPNSMYKLLKKYNLNPGEAIMIGDTVTDMRFAKAAGVDACAMVHGYGATKEVLNENPEYSLAGFYDF